MAGGFHVQKECGGEEVWDVELWRKDGGGVEKFQKEMKHKLQFPY